ncbi:MAG: hypothetical protein J7K48_00090 [Thermococcus sp.]|nr:hypothetical protein [Thermococcus sp.]
MLRYLIKIITRRMSFFLLILMSFIVSLLIFGIVGQVNHLVDENIEYTFTHYRPHAVYSLSLDFGREVSLSNMSGQVSKIINTLEKNLTNKSLSIKFLMALPVTYVKPLQINGHTIYFQAYFFRDIKDVEEFGFKFNSSKNHFLLLSYNLSRELTPEDVSSYFLGKNISLVEAYGIFREYPLDSLSNVEYVQVAVPLTNKTLSEYSRWINRDILNASGLRINIYVAVNIKNSIRDPHIIDNIITSKMPRSLTTLVVRAYTEIYGNDGVVIDLRNEINGSRRLYFNRTWINPNDEEYLVKVINQNEGIRIVSSGVTLRQADITNLVRNAGTQTVKFFGKYGGLLVVIYLPFFLLVLYAASTVFRELRSDLEILELRGIHRNFKVVQEFFIFSATGLASVSAYVSFCSFSDYSPSLLVILGVIGFVYLAMLVARIGDTWRFGRTLELLLVILLSAFILLGYMRVNSLVLAGRGYGSLMLLFSLLMALVPVMGIFIGYFFHKVCKSLVQFFEFMFDVRYYFRSLTGYSYILTFSAYSLGLSLLPRIVSLNKVLNAVFQNREYVEVVGHDDITSLGLLADYLNKLSPGFGIMGLLAISLIILISLRKYFSIREYSSLRGGDPKAIKQSFLKFLILKMSLITLLSVMVTVVVAIFLDAYIGVTYTSGRIVFENGKLTIQSLFRPPHVFVWG